MRAEPSQPFRIVGVLNVTPDSFFDGGQLTSVDHVLQRAEQMLSDGADILEIGGESTGPKSVDVSVDEELRRIVPAIDAIRKNFPEAQLSVDTYKSIVAKAALERGVTVINDVTAGRADPAMFATVAASRASLVLMYAKDPTPRTTVEARDYDDVIATIKTFLAERKAVAIAGGVSADRIILDPGLGHFVSSKSEYSYTILAQLPAFAALGSPLLLSPSRKSFLAGPRTLPTAERLPATIAASALAVFNGASYIRTHDVADVKKACDVAAATISRRTPR